MLTEEEKKYLETFSKVKRQEKHKIHYYLDDQGNEIKLGDIVNLFEEKFRRKTTKGTLIKYIKCLNTNLVNDSVNIKMGDTEMNVIEIPKSKTIFSKSKKLSGTDLKLSGTDNFRRL